jgi:diguanylate cyclase (GGDEF)-like protein/PAS domain S-box-containing protein
VKNADSLVTLSSVLTRTLLAIAGVFSLAVSAIVSGYLCWLDPAGFSPSFLIFIWPLSIIILLPLVVVARQYLVRLIANPITHLIANTQLGSAQHSGLRNPVTNIAEINILGRSIVYMTAKILQRGNMIVDSERRLSLALTGSGEGVWDWNVKHNRSYIDGNCCEIIGVSPEEINNDNRLWVKYLHPDDIEPAKNNFRRAIIGDLMMFEQDYRIKKASDRDWNWIHVRGSVVEWDEQGMPVRMAGTISDVTDRKNAEQKLQLYSTAFMCTKNAVIMLDEAFVVLTVNRAFCEITQHQAASMIGKPYLFNQSNISSTDFGKMIQTQVQNRTQWVGEAVGFKADGTRFPQELAVYGVFDENRKLTHYVAIFSDITERKHTEESLRILANFDPLTGLANRYLFNATLTRSLQSAKRKDEKLALLFIDLDHFKQVNDLFGHEAGDLLLIDVAQRIQRNIRETDLAARLAGDEFVVILENIQTESDVEQIANKIISAMIGVGSDHALMKAITISVSIGISLSPDHGTDVETLLRKADSAMYEAKTLGRNRLAFFHSDLAQIHNRQASDEKI